MAPTTSKRFVTRMVMACLPKTDARIRFDYGSMFTASSMEHDPDDNHTRHGTTHISVYGESGDIYADYDLHGPGDDTWTEGRCSIRISTMPDQAWEFYCELQADGQLLVSTLEAYRRRKALRLAVESAVNGLGGSPGPIAGRLLRLGYTGDVSGLSRFVSEIFALEGVEVTMTEQAGKLIPEIRGQRPGNPDLTLKLRLSSGSASRFIAAQLNPVA